MNFNDLLIANGMSPLERDLNKKFTMLVKSYEQTSWVKVAPYPCITMEKMDGVCTIAVCIYGKWYLFSRTGRKLQNVEHLERLLESRNSPRNMVVLLELCHDGMSLEEISGIVNPNRKEPLVDELGAVWVDGAYMAAFDMVTLCEFIKGRSDMSFSHRLTDLERQINRPDGLPCVVPAYHHTLDEASADAFFDYVVSNGGEGTVQCLFSGHWIAGHKNREKTKKVRGVDFDLEVIDVVEGKGKRSGTMAKVVVRWRQGGKPDGKIERLAVDGRFDDTTRAKYWATPSLIIGSIVHVHALQIGSKGSLRLAKVRSVRIDKQEADL